MRAALSGRELRQCGLLAVGILFLLGFGLFLGIELFPSGIEYHPAAGLESGLSDLGLDRGLLIFAVGEEHRYEPHHNQVEHRFLPLGEVRTNHSCGDDGMVVGYLRVVKHLLALLKLLSANGAEK